MRVELKSRNLSTNGKKSDLIQRLESNDNNKNDLRIKNCKIILHRIDVSKYRTQTTQNTAEISPVGESSRHMTIDSNRDEISTVQNNGHFNLKNWTMVQPDLGIKKIKIILHRIDVKQYQTQTIAGEAA